MYKEKMVLGAGGGGGKSPKRTDDNLYSEDVLEIALAVSEGPIRGLTEGAKTFYVGDTPLVSSTGGLNFNKFAIGVYPGYSEESSKPIALKLGGTTSNTTIGVELQQYTSVTRQTAASLRNTIDELEVRIYFARLMHIGSDGGTNYETARFRIEYKQSLASTWSVFGDPVEVRGKTSTGYPQDFRIPVPRVNDDWMVRVTKLSPDNSDTEVVVLSWESLQCTTREARKYPWVAVVHGLGVSDGQFSSIPEFSGVFDGMIVRVPTNYNPDLRTYDESTPWDGSFKFAWTNNNAWILYHLLVDTRCGMAAHYPYLDVNRFDFYDAAKWCDTPVPAGTGFQPRFTFNAVLNEPRNALEMLAYVAGSFNALVYDDLSGKVHLRVDRDEFATQIFTPESAGVDGFNYTFTDLTTRYNDISVTFVNPNLDWNEDRRRIPGVTTNEDAIIAYGRIPLDFIAVGCTNEYEAIRRAQHRLITSQTETTMVSFTTTRVGVLTQLYDIILLSDPTMGWGLSGRIKGYDENYIYLRDPLFLEINEPHTLRIQNVQGIEEVVVLVDELGYVSRLRLQDPLPVGLPEHTVFTLEKVGSLGLAKPFRVTSVEPVEGSLNGFTISAIEVNRAKYLEGDAVAELPEFQYSYKQPTLPGQPTNVLAQSGDNFAVLTDSGDTVDRIFLGWRAPNLSGTISGYEVRWRREDDSEWELITTLAENAFLAPVVPQIEYTIQVRSITQSTKSAWVTITHTVQARTIAPQALSNLTTTGGLFQIELDWDYGTSSDYKRVEIWGGMGIDPTTFTKLTDLAYPQTTWTHLALGAAQTVYYRMRAFSKTEVPSNWTSVVQGDTENDASELLEVLTDQITAGQLAPELLGPIEDAALKTTTFRQNTQPTAINTGDLWYDNSDNYLYYTEQFDQATWVKVLGATVTFDGATAPDGTTSADILNFPTTANTRVQQETGLVPVTGETWTFSIWLRGTGTISVVIDGQNGVGGTSETSVTLTSTWQRFSISVTYSTGFEAVRVMVVKRSTNTATSVAAWGAQLEKAQAQAGRYIRRQTTRGPEPLNWVFYWDGTAWVQTDNSTIERVRAAIVTEEAARIAADSANASLITTVQSSLSNASGNRVSNSSFEVDSNGDNWADGYAIYNNGGVAYSVELQTGRNGGKCQRVNFTGSGTETMGIAPISGTNRNWEAGKTYVLSFYAKGYTGQSGRVMGLYWNTAPSAVVALANPGLSSTVWQRYVFRITWGTSVEAGGRFYISSATGAPSRSGTLDFDDIQVEEGAYVTSYIPPDGATALAAVQTEATTRANADNAINNSLAAMYNIKTSISVDGRTYMSGIGVGVTNSSGIIESTILLAASKVAIIDPNAAGVMVSPFIVTGGQVIINNAIIGNATITFAKIADDIQSTSYVANSAGWRLKKDGTGQLGGMLLDGTGLQSFNYVAGTSGFRLRQDGSFEIQNLTARGNIEALTLKADAVDIVKTLHIQTDAVIVPRASKVYIENTGTAGNAWISRVSSTISDLLSTTKVAIVFRVFGEPLVPSSGSNMRLLRNGVVLFQSEGRYFGNTLPRDEGSANNPGGFPFDIPAQTLLDVPGTTSATYEIQTQRVYNCQLTCEILLFATKKAS